MTCSPKLILPFHLLGSVAGHWHLRSFAREPTQRGFNTYKCRDFSSSQGTEGIAPTFSPSSVRFLTRTGRTQVAADALLCFSTQQLTPLLFLEGEEALHDSRSSLASSQAARYLFSFIQSSTTRPPPFFLPVAVRNISTLLLPAAPKNQLFKFGIEYQLPNLVVGAITKESQYTAFDNGITAEQIISFLQQNAHPRVLERVPAVPENVTDQIRLWETDRNRVEMIPSHLYEDFPSKEVFEAASDFAREIGGLLWEDSKKLRLIVRGELHQQMRDFLRGPK